jgi:signal transduction histidine kinase
MDAYQTKIFTAVILASALIGGILILFIILLIIQQRKNAKLYLSKITAEITTLENERQRVSADLHDELGPVLSAIKLKLSSVDVADQNDIIQLEESANLLDDIINRIRAISNDLMPLTLLRKGIVIATTDFINKLPRELELKITFSSDPLPELSKDQAINLFRIIQEIIHNTLKHAKATNLKISLHYQSKIISLITEDNGMGFNQKIANKENSGLGLRNILSRTEVLHGEMFINSNQGEGTKYVINIPVNDKSESYEN